MGKERGVLRPTLRPGSFLYSSNFACLQRTKLRFSKLYRSALSFHHFTLNSFENLVRIFWINPETFCLELYHFRSKITPQCIRHIFFFIKKFWFLFAVMCSVHAVEEAGHTFPEEKTSIELSVTAHMQPLVAVCAKHSPRRKIHCPLPGPGRCSRDIARSGRKSCRSSAPARPAGY